MKNIFFVLVVSVIYAGCTGNTTASEESNASKSKSASSDISYPYTASFSSEISRGNDSNALLVLNSYKAWETGDMSALANTLSDSVEMLFGNGTHIMATRDSAMRIAKNFRDSLSSVKIEMNVWEPVRAEDKSDDAVLVWYTETDTYKNGKVDSADYHEVNGVKDGKITFIESYRRPKNK